MRRKYDFLFGIEQPRFKHPHSFNVIFRNRIDGNCLQLQLEQQLEQNWKKSAPSYL